MDKFLRRLLPSVGKSEPNTILVGPGQRYSTISAAMKSIKDAAPNKVYTLRLLPGYKTVNRLWETMTWKAYVMAEWVGNMQLQAYGGLNTFNGVDFSPCADEEWVPWHQPTYALKLGAQDNNENEVAGIEDLTLEAGAVAGDIYLVPDNGSGIPKMYCFSGGDFADIDNWIDITTNCMGLSFRHNTALEASAVSLINTQFRNVNLSGSNFYQANLEGAYITYCDLTNSSFYNANLQYANLSGSNCRYVDFNSANCTEAAFIDCDLTGAVADGMILTDATMPEGIASAADFKALVGSYDASTTIWTDGNPIGA